MMFINFYISSPRYRVILIDTMYMHILVYKGRGGERKPSSGEKIPSPVEMGPKNGGFLGK